MSIKRTDSQQTSCNVILVDEGERQQVATAACVIRPGQGMNFSIDVNYSMEISAEDMAEIAAMFRGYLTDELKKAKALGIPIE